MAPFQPQDAEQHFALQRSDRANEAVKAAGDAQLKGAELNRSVNERFFHNVALFSSGAIALSLTYLGYLKTLSKPIQHVPWLKAAWSSLLTSAVFSLFWSFVYGYYSHYFHERQYAELMGQKHKTDAEVWPIVARGSFNAQTKEPLTKDAINNYKSTRAEAARKYDERAEGAGRLERRYEKTWRWLGRIAQAAFVAGLGLLIAFAIKNT